MLDPARDGLGARVPEVHAPRIALLKESGLRLQMPVLPIGTEEQAAPQLRRMLGAAAAPRGAAHESRRRPTREAMHGLILPPPVPFWPATPAWFVLLALLALLVAWLGWRAWRRWRPTPIGARRCARCSARNRRRSRRS